MSEQTVSMRLEADASMFKQELVESGKVADDLAGNVQGAGQKIDKVLAGFGDSGAKAEAMLKGLDTRVGELTGADRDVVIRANIAQFENGIRQIESALGDPSLTTTEVKILVDRRNEAVKAVENLKEEIGELGPAAKAAGDEIERGLNLGALGGSLASAGLADRFNDATTSAGAMRAQLGLTGDEAREFDAISKQVYRNNFGDTMGHASQVTGVVHQSLGLVGDELSNATQLIFSVSDAFEHVGADTQMMTDNLRVMKASWPGLDETRGLDLIANSFQSGTGNAGDLLDTIQEYSPIFADMGFSADDMFLILNEGMRNGARNTDFLADAFKELGIRIQTEGDTGQQALAKMFPPDEAERLITDFSRGGEAARDAFEVIAGALVDVKDPQDQYNLAVELFGTKAEDLSTSLIPTLQGSLDGLASSTDGARGAAELTGEQYTGFRNTLEGLMRSIETSALGTIGEVGVGFGDVAANAGIAILGFQGIKDVLPGLNDGLGGTARKLGQFVGRGGLLAGVAVSATMLGDALADLVGRGPRDLSSISEELELLARTGEGFDVGRIVEALDTLADPSLAQNLDSAGQKIVNYGTSLGGLFGSGSDQRFNELRRELEATDDALAEMVSSGNTELAARNLELFAEAAGWDSAEVLAALPEYSQALELAGARASDAEGPVAELSGGLDAQKTVVDEVIGAWNAYSDALSAQFDPLFAAQDATLNLSEATAELDAIMQDAEATQGEIEAAHRNVIRSTIDQEQAMVNLATAVANGDVDMAAAVETVRRLTDGQANGAETAAFFDAEVERLSAGLANVPDAVASVSVTGIAKAEADLNWVARNRTARIQGVVVGFTSRGGKVTESHDGGAVFKADGGSVFRGRGTDVVPAMLGTDEFVMRGEAVQRFGLPFMEAINAGQLPGGGASAPASIDLNITLDSGDGIIRYFRRRIKTEAGRSAEVFFRS